MFRKFLIGTLVIIFFISMLAGCIKIKEKHTKIKDTTVQDFNKKVLEEDSQNAKIRITYWDHNAGPNRTPYFQELIKRFHAQNNRIDVEYVGIPWKSAKEKYDVAVASNTVPDICGMPQFWIAGFIARDALVNLEDYYNRWDKKDEIIQSQVDSIISTAVDGKLYSIPYTGNSNVIWYRNDVFEQKNVQIPDDWNDFFNATQKLTDDKMFGFSIRGGMGSSYHVQDSLYAYSGIKTYFDEDGNCTINDSIHIEFLERFVGIYKIYTPESDIANGYKEMVAAFDTGTVAMIHHNLGSYAEHSETLGDDKFTAMPMPKSKNGYYNLLGGNLGGYALFKTDSKERQDAAWEFLTFLLSEKSNSYWNEMIGQLPVNIKVMNHKWVSDRQHIKAALDALAKEDTNLMIPPVELPGYGSIHTDLLMPAFQEVLLGKLSAKDYLDEWARAMEEEKRLYDTSKSK